MKKNETKNNSKLSLVEREFNGKKYEFLELSIDTTSGDCIKCLIDIRLNDSKRKAKLFYKIKKCAIGLYE